jgi:glycosyltransferase involved in cell wall biosynthesis
MRYSQYIAKRTAENILLLPFILAGRMMGMLRPPKKQYRCYFFFPFYHTGGAEKIHAQIAQACGGPDCVIYFTRKSVNRTFYDQFVASGCNLADISRYTDNKLLYIANFLFRGIVSYRINRQSTRPFVFNGHSNFAYKLSPWLDKKIRQVDLVHSLNTFSLIRIPFIPFYDETVLISRVKRQAHIELYRKLGVPEGFGEKLTYIPNASDFPLRSMDAKPQHPFGVLFSGRNSPEKRFPLFLRVAERVHATDPTIRFAVIGGIDDPVDRARYPFIDFHGELQDKGHIHDLYFQNSALLLTSATEGFPLVVIEAMANGCAILATPVGDIPDHVRNGQQGFVFTTTSDEEKIVDEAVRHILALATNPVQWGEMGAANILYAQEHFSLEQFNAAYRRLVNRQGS